MKEFLPLPKPTPTAAAPQALSPEKPMASRRAWLACAGSLGISIIQPGIGWAGEPKKKPLIKGTPKTHYLVSAILREGV
jgi:hypothetical protein